MLQILEDNKVHTKKTVLLKLTTYTKWTNSSKCTDEHKLPSMEQRPLEWPYDYLGNLFYNLKILPKDILRPNDLTREVHQIWK